MNSLVSIMQTIYDFIWGPPMLVLLVGAGIILSLRFKFIQFREFGFVLKNTIMKLFDKDHSGDGEVTPFQALSTALAATVGTGNIVGVSSAILAGGPGAVFWMWIAAIFGMATKYTEVTLAVAYRENNSEGEIMGGPMYYISKGLNLPWLGKIFAVFAALATFGIGNSVQANSISNILYENLAVPKIATGIVTAVIATIVIIGGIKRIGAFTEKLVPIMALFYVLGAFIVLFVHRAAIPEAFTSIFKYAFTPRAAASGAAGYTIALAIRNGVARGVFTNEAGLGSSPIAHAAATTDHPVRQGIWGIFEVFIDTIVVCTMTALVILSSGAWETTDNAAAVVAASFEQGFPAGQYIVVIGLTLFALSTILSWEYYGEVSARYVFGDKAGLIYKIIYIPFIVVGATVELDIIWLFADVLNGLMAIPNLIGVIGLSGVAWKLTQDFFNDPARIRVNDEWKTIIK